MHLWIYTLRIDEFHGGNRRFNDALSSVNRILYVGQCANRICLLYPYPLVYYAAADLSIYDPHALEATNGHRIRLLWKLLCTFAIVASLLIGFVVSSLLRVDCLLLSCCRCVCDYWYYYYWDHWDNLYVYAMSLIRSMKFLQTIALVSILQTKKSLSIGNTFDITAFPKTLRFPRQKWELHASAETGWRNRRRLQIRSDSLWQHSCSFLI